MLSAAVHHLSRRFPNSTFSVLSVYPGEDRQLNADPRVRIVGAKPRNLALLIFPLCLLYRVLHALHLPCRFVRRLPAVRALLDADLVVDVAGISFSDGRGIIVLYNALMILPVLLLGKRLFKASQAFGPFHRPLNRLLARLCLARAAALVPRGAVSQQHLAEIGFPDRPICADVAFAMPVEEAAAAAAEEVCGEAFFRSANLIGVSPSTVVERYCAKRGIDYPGIMARFVEHLIEAYDANVVLLAHAARVGKPKSRTNDLPTCQRVYDQVSRKDRCRFLDSAQSAEELRHIIGKMRFFVASRFHAMISGLTMGVPTLLVGWSHKYLEVLDMFELGDWQMDFADFSWERVSGKFRELVAGEQEVRDKIAAHLPSVRESSERNWELAAALLSAPILRAEPKAPFGSREGAEFWLGKFDGCYVGCAGQEEVRNGAASGGAVSAVLIRLLESGRIDGALVSRLVPRDGRLEPETWVARTREEILSARTSIYLDFPLGPHLLALKDEPGRYAVVGLPCQLSGLRKLEQKHPELGAHIAFRLGLACGHASHRKLLEEVLRRKKLAQEEIEEFAFRKGHWRGRSYVRLKDGREITFPYLDFGLYQNLWLHCAPRCLACVDHFAEHSEVSFGDAWLSELKSHPIKHSLLLSRTPEATAVLEEMMASGALAAEAADPFTLIRAQRRSLVYHKKNVAGRSRLAPWFGLKVSYSGPHRPRLNDLLGAPFFLLPVRLSKSDRWVRLLIGLPKVLLYPYLALMKLTIQR